MRCAYEKQSRDLTRHTLASPVCVYCGTPLQDHSEERSFESRTSIVRTLSTCSSCGWWRTTESTLPSCAEEQSGHLLRGAAGTLKHLDNPSVDLSVPAKELKDYLRRNYDSRFSIHPLVFEKAVAEVFRGLGYEAVVSGHAADGGVDVFLVEPNGEMIAVQVKRTRSNIGVSQIRELLGALVVKGQTRGMYVTTSDFTHGARESALAAKKLGMRIDLVNADDLYARLGLFDAGIAAHIPPYEAPSMQDVKFWMGSVHPGNPRDAVNKSIPPPWSSTPPIIKSVVQATAAQPDWAYWVRCLMIDSETTELGAVASSHMVRMSENYHLSKEEAILLAQTLESSEISLLKPFFLLDGTEIPFEAVSTAVATGKLIFEGGSVESWQDRVAMAWRHTQKWSELRREWARHE